MPVLTLHIGIIGTNPVSPFSKSCIQAPLYHPAWVHELKTATVKESQLPGMSWHVGKEKTADVFLPLTSPSGALLLWYLSYHPSIHKPSLRTRLSLLCPHHFCWVCFLFFILSFSCFTYNLLLYKVFKILFVLYDVSMVMFFIKEEENLFLLLVCFIILF